jgi:hypothetical protein
MIASMSWRRAASLAALLLGGIWQAAPAGAVIVERSPFGLSMEYPLIERALGAGPCPSPALVATWRALGSPSLRIGGDSQDLAGLTPAYHYDVPPTLWPTLGCMARETGAQITVGLNRGQPNRRGRGGHRGRVAVREHIARLTLGPSTVVALKTS